MPTHKEVSVDIKKIFEEYYEYTKNKGEISPDTALIVAGNLTLAHFNEQNLNYIGENISEINSEISNIKNLM